MKYEWDLISFLGSAQERKDIPMRLHSGAAQPQSIRSSGGSIIDSDTLMSRTAMSGNLIP